MHTIKKKAMIQLNQKYVHYDTGMTILVLDVAYNIESERDEVQYMEVKILKINGETQYGDTFFMPMDEFKKSYYWSKSFKKNNS
jgi:hypothetical protein